MFDDGDVNEPDEGYTVIDTSLFTQAELIKKLKDQVFTQAMLPVPQPSILVLATKVFNVVTDGSVDDSDDYTAKMTTDDIVKRLSKLVKTGG